MSAQTVELGCARDTSEGRHVTIRTDTLDHRRRADPTDEVGARAERLSSPATAREESVLALQQTAGNAATTALVRMLAEGAGGSTLPFTEQDLQRRCYDASIADGMEDSQLAEAVELAAQAVNGATEPTELETARSNQLIFEIALRGRAVVGAASSATARTAAIEALVDFSRDQIATLPRLVGQFREQASPSVDEKVRVLGQLAAAVARMEFLLGSMMYQGGGWEESSNRGAMVDDYTGGTATQWCSLFASTMWERITGRRMRAASGYKLANPTDFGLDITYDTASGGGFVGSRGTRAASATRGGNYNPWAELRQTLLDIDAGRIPDQSRTDALETFLTDHGLRPQAGDIMIVKRGSADANSFTAGEVVNGRRRGAFQSHTTMVESFSGSVVSTIEGNADDRVRGRTYDLSNPDDVAKVVFLARPGIEPVARAETERAAETAAAEIPPAETATAPVVGAGELLGPVQALNALLQRLASVVGGIAATSSAAQTVADLSPEGDTGRSN